MTLARINAHAKVRPTKIATANARSRKISHKTVWRETQGRERSPLSKVIWVLLGRTACGQRG